MLTNIFFSFSLVSLLACSNPNCADLPSSFTSYERATQQVQNATFKVKESLENSSSWIEDATYYSCDGKFGFLIIETEKQKYVHQNVPISVWKDFKKANSAGSYYTKHIKNRYQISIQI